MPADYREYRRLQLENGQLFQDFCVDALYAAGIPVAVYSSKLYQLRVGESRGGWEFKYDMQYAKTGNLWIEVAEKAYPRAGDYVPSGIYARTNTIFYCIGNYDRLFIFAKNLLTIFHLSKRYSVIENGTKTSMGFLLPDKDARRFAVTILEHQLQQVMKGNIDEIRQQAVELYRKIKPQAEDFTLPLPWDDDSVIFKP